MRACDRFVSSIPEFHDGTSEWLANVKDRYIKFDISGMKEWLGTSGLDFSSDICVKPPFEEMLFFCEYPNSESMVMVIEENAGPSLGVLVSCFVKWRNTPFIFEGCAEINHDEKWMPNQEICFKLSEKADSFGIEAKQQSIDFVAIMARATVRILQLLNCKNIATVAHDPIDLLKPSVRAHWLRKNKRPLQKHYTLSVRIPGEKKQPTQGGISTERIMPLHTCRGHFSTYTEEHKLFGKYTGTFWIPAHVRGNAKNGTITKDYALKPQVAACN